MENGELEGGGGVPREHAAKPISETARFGTLVAGAYGCLCVSLSFGFNIFSGDLQKDVSSFAGRHVDHKHSGYCLCLLWYTVRLCLRLLWREACLRAGARTDYCRCAAHGTDVQRRHRCHRVAAVRLQRHLQLWHGCL
ncbi:uncharacterized protein Tco025E_06766 [Trypanosoma conorhini]|uniref:Uncharacterized protein n=1 Tax=Trypanosoma conorhini TaxID=83891 RepID=A0A3R7M7Q6_9TRYP|nr:uncharacterized protein Tco025E_06766 [Trypanosoma conorhini]RNF10587.1 hypothetical protein Tco025E_06766 [Trypanosoma conorhini]